MLDDNLDPTISPKKSDSFEESATPMGKATISDFGEIYSSYAAGCLDPAFCLLVETQAALRPEVERAAKVSEGAINKALAMIDAYETDIRPTA